MNETPLQRYERAAEAYRRILHGARKQTLCDRAAVVVAIVRQHLRAILMCCAVGTMLAGCAVLANAAEIPAWVIRGIAAVETGTDWRGIGDVRGTWERGAIGEVGPWQLSPNVLRDLKSHSKRERIHRDPVFAESLTRAWLLHLYARTGSWRETCAAFHAGLGRRSESFAINYANRVKAAGTAAEAFGASSAAGAAPSISVESTTNR